jgi:uncharacterized protein (TIGR03083 family)
MRAPVGPVYLVDLFPGLHAELMTLLRGLQPGDWSLPTACALWSVKDIAAHLLDTCLRRLSSGRDRLDLAPDRPIAGYSELVDFLNSLNAQWVAAARRLSPRVLMDLMDLVVPQLHAYFRTLDPHDTARFGVAWAGEERSANWFDVGREYTERWLHQQQIREAVGAPLLNQRQWLHPVLDIFVRALPFTYKPVDAKAGSRVELVITGDAGGIWTLLRDAGGWVLFAESEPTPTARVILDQDTAWKLFSKGLSAPAASREIHFEGDPTLGRPLLGSLAVMA